MIVLGKQLLVTKKRGENVRAEMARVSNNEKSYKAKLKEIKGDGTKNLAEML
jgi:hypothetical protein